MESQADDVAQHGTMIDAGRTFIPLLTPNDFRSLTAVKDRLLHFQAHYEDSASPFQWTFTRRDLHRLLAKLAHRPRGIAA